MQLILNAKRKETIVNIGSAVISHATHWIVNYKYFLIINNFACFYELAGLLSCLLILAPIYLLFLKKVKHRSILESSQYLLFTQSKERVNFFVHSDRLLKPKTSRPLHFFIVFNFLFNMLICNNFAQQLAISLLIITFFWNAILFSEHCNI